MLGFFEEIGEGLLGLFIGSRAATKTDDAMGLRACVGAAITGLVLGVIAYPLKRWTPAFDWLLGYATPEFGDWVLGSVMVFVTLAIALYFLVMALEGKQIFPPKK